LAGVADGEGVAMLATKASAALALTPATRMRPPAAAWARRGPRRRRLTSLPQPLAAARLWR
jgi:hypothetical protein